LNKYVLKCCFSLDYSAEIFGGFGKILYLCSDKRGKISLAFLTLNF